MDSAQFEEFGRPTLWRPGAIGAGVTLDVGGVMVNAAQDAYFRLQGTNNTSSSVVDLSTMGLRQRGGGHRGFIKESEYLRGRRAKVGRELNVIRGNVDTSNLIAR